MLIGIPDQDKAMWWMGLLAEEKMTRFRSIPSVERLLPIDAAGT